MKNLLLKNFLTNKSLYGRAQTRWRKFVAAQAKEAALSSEPYLEATDALDGNPLYHAYFPKINRALKIVQLDPRQAADYPFLIGWIDPIQLPAKDVSARELVIFILLTKETEPVAQSWIHSWLLGGATPRELERVIREEAVLTEDEV
jgi:hypothetical protein